MKPGLCLSSENQAGHYDAKSKAERIISKTADLANKTIYVQGGTSVIKRLELLSKELKDSIYVIEVPYEPEKLIGHVASGEIDYTVCEENVAVVNATYYPGIDVSTVVCSPLTLSWGVRRYKSDLLIYELNRWLTVYKTNRVVQNALYQVFQ